MSAAPVDIVVIGGGPAGAAAARLLAAWGHSVQVLAKPADDARTLGESLPPSCRKLFDLIGVTGDVEAAGFLSSTGNTVWWGGRDPRAVRFAGGGIGWQVRRSELDRLLLRLASQAGAAVETDAVVRQVDLAPPSDPAGAAESSTRYLAGGDARSLRAAFVLDCSGRAGVVARRGFRRHAAGRTTLALTAVWSRPGGWGLPDESHTLVESYGDGWAWSVPVTAERRYFTLMVDPRVTRLERGGPLAPCYEAELAKTAALGPLTAGAALDVEPWGCDASVYDAHAYRAPGMLLVGDAGSFIDPLSSYGVKKALASGWLAAVVVHTALTDPALAGVALDLFDEREREMHAALERQSAEFFAEAAGRHDHPFWTDRAEPGVPEAAPLAPPEPAIDALRRDPGVLTAFEALRRAPVAAAPARRPARRRPPPRHHRPADRPGGPPRRLRLAGRRRRPGPPLPPRHRPRPGGGAGPAPPAGPRSVRGLQPRLPPGAAAGLPGRPVGPHRQGRAAGGRRSGPGVRTVAGITLPRAAHRHRRKTELFPEVVGEVTSIAVLSPEQFEKRHLPTGLQPRDTHRPAHLSRQAPPSFCVPRGAAPNGPGPAGVEPRRPAWRPVRGVFRRGLPAVGPHPCARRTWRLSPSRASRSR